MAFGTFKKLEEVVRTYQVPLRTEEFIQPIACAVDEHLQKRLRIFLKNAPVRTSEEAICEFLIAPVLQEIWLSYLDSLTLWSHPPFGNEPPLIGYPDYLFARRSPLGPFLEPPYVFFIEAKRDDFDLAWAQCLAAMLAAQKMNPSPELIIHGGVSNGELWYFGKLQGNALIQDPRGFTLTHLAELFAALHYLFAQAKLQVAASSAGDAA